MNHDLHFQGELEALLFESRRRVLERLPLLTELGLDALEQALRIPYLSGARLDTARYIIDRLLGLSARLTTHDGAEVFNAGLNPAPIEEDAEVAKEEMAQGRTLEHPSAEEIQAVLQRAKAAIARHLADGRGPIDFEADPQPRSNIMIAQPRGAIRGPDRFRIVATDCGHGAYRGTGRIYFARAHAVDRCRNSEG
jgi:hypothetical protein